MTQVAPVFQQAGRIRESTTEKGKGLEGAPEGTQAAVFTRKPTAPIYGGSEERGGGQGNPRQAVEFLRDAKTGELRAVARRVVQSEKMRMFPESSPLRLIGPAAQPVVFERETRADLGRKHFVPTPFSRTDKYSPLFGSPITFAPEDLPFNAAVPFDARRMTLPADEHRQMQAGMADARMNKGPVAWGLRHGAIRV